VHLPQAGTYFVPSHLRGLHISMDPLFIQGSLLENLRFGVATDDDGEIVRVRSILKMIGLEKEMIDHLESDQVLMWHRILSATQRSMVNIARGLIANPEMLCIHKPTNAFSERRALKVMKLLKQFCLEKGLAQNPDDFHHRRPRTCIVSCEQHTGINEADQVYDISVKNGIQECPLDGLRRYLANEGNDLSNDSPLKTKLL